VLLCQHKLECQGKQILKCVFLVLHRVFVLKRCFFLLSSPPANLPKGAILYAQALFDFRAEEKGELTFRAGDWIAVFSFDPAVRMELF
jgi:hypothetical protein